MTEALYARRQPTGDGVGGGRERHAERGGRLGEAGKEAVQRVEHHGDADEDGRRVEVAARRVHDAAVTTEQVADGHQRRQQEDAAPEPLRPVALPPGERINHPHSTGSRASTVSPATTCWPARTRISARTGRDTSMRDPNFIRPIRSPRASCCPSATRQTMRRASTPTICLTTTGSPQWSIQTSFSSFWFASSWYAGRNFPARYSMRVTRPSTGVRFMCTSIGDRKIVTCCQAPGGLQRGSAGPARTTPAPPRAPPHARP